MSVNFGKTAEAIKLLFGMVNVVGLMEWCVTWRHAANTVERLFYEWVCHQRWRHCLFPNYTLRNLVAVVIRDFLLFDKGY